jgi:hypothetical protein
MFKPNPKKQVELKFQELFGRTHRVSVLGSRLTPEECRRLGVRCLTRDGVYRTELHVDGQLLAEASDRDWRAAYKKLKFEVEKLYAEGKSVS